MWMLATTSMLVVLLAHHLGFVAKVYKVLGMIARCSMCSVFWATLVLLWLYGYEVVEVVVASFIVAYLSNWVAMIYEWLSYIYDKVWERLRILMRRR